jgi:uncharacterized damage-inducible protein DinB
MNPLLRDLYGHQEWSDAEHCRAIEAHPPALADQAIRDRLHHVHLVQHVFLWAAGDRQAPPRITKPADFADSNALKEYGRSGHRALSKLLEAMAPERFAEIISMPWAPEGSAVLTVERALTQAAMHSHYHRGQNATRLRELGGVPPTTDLIVWYWRNQPAATWD